MNAAAMPGLLIATLLVSGCVQDVAPRHPPQAAPPQDVESPTLARLALQVDENPDPAVRREAIFQVADRGEAEDVAVIGQALYDPDASVRLAAVKALTGVGDESAADWMLVALGDPDPRIRRTAVEALGEIGGGTARMLLQQSLADADEGVRVAARQMLDEPGFAESDFR